MTNNKQIELLKNRIEKVEIKVRSEYNLSQKINYIEQEIALRKQYTPLLLRKRPMLLTIGIVFAIFYGISLMICLPPYIIRGKKRDINENKIAKLEVELEVLKNKLDKDKEQKEIEVSSASASVCLGCGSALNDADLFCSYCGKKK